MSTGKIMMLQDQHGTTLFLQDMLIAQGLAGHVDLAGRFDQAVDLIDRAGTYDLVVINLPGAWEDGLRLAGWLNQQVEACPILLIVPPEFDSDSIHNNFVALPTPLSLCDFTESTRFMLQQSKN